MLYNKKRVPFLGVAEDVSSSTLGVSSSRELPKDQLLPISPSILKYSSKSKLLQRTASLPTTIDGVKRLLTKVRQTHRNNPPSCSAVLLEPTAVSRNCETREPKHGVILPRPTPQTLLDFFYSHTSNPTVSHQPNIRDSRASHVLRYPLEMRHQWLEQAGRAPGPQRPREAGCKVIHLETAQIQHPLQGPGYTL